MVALPSFKKAFIILQEILLNVFISVTTNEWIPKETQLFRTFPAPFYTISYEFGPQKTRVDIIAIDTINLCGNTVDLEHAGFFGFFKMLFSKTNTDPHQPKNVTLAEHYLQWIEHQLNSSK